MLRSSLKRFMIGRHLRDAIGRGLVELDEGVTFAAGLQLKLEGIGLQLRVGKRSHLDGRIVVRGSGHVHIGAHCSFRAGTYLGSVVGIDIGDSVFGAEGVFIVDNNNHPLDPEARRVMTQHPMGHPLWQWTAPGVASAATRIGDNVWLGRNSAVLKGVDIGNDSVVALAAVLTKSVPEGAVVAGNPARVVRRLY